MYCENYGNFPFCKQCLSKKIMCRAYKETTEEKMQEILQKKGKKIWY